MKLHFRHRFCAEFDTAPQNVDQTIGGNIHCMTVIKSVIKNPFCSLLFSPNLLPTFPSIFINYLTSSPPPTISPFLHPNNFEIRKTYLTRLPDKLAIAWLHMWKTQIRRPIHHILSLFLSLFWLPSPWLSKILCLMLHYNFIIVKIEAISIMKCNSNTKIQETSK